MLWDLGDELRRSNREERQHKFKFPLYSEERKFYQESLDDYNGNLEGVVVGDSVGSILAQVDGSMGSMRLEAGEEVWSEVGYSGIQITPRPHLTTVINNTSVCFGVLNEFRDR